MASTVIIPRKSRVYVSVPQSYIGKQVEVSFALKEETNKPKSAIPLSEMFRGVFSKEDAESFIKHTQTMRSEWDNYLINLSISCNNSATDCLPAVCQTTFLSGEIKKNDG